jgi:myo-inositol-1(or 4)-monophosphatase
MIDIEELKKICDEAVVVVKEAGRFIASQIGKVQQSDIIEKEKNSLVSYVDIETEKILVKGLRNIISDADFLTEEDTVEKVESKSDWKWIIDPLDGTTNFLKGIPAFCVSVGLSFREELVVGVIYDMNRDECFTATKSGGAFLNNKKIEVSRIDKMKDSVIATGFPYSINQLEGLIELLRNILQNVRGVRRMGSAALDLAYTACGRYDSYYELRINPWDVAAGILIVREAGGRVSDIFGNEDVLYSKNILATNNITHNEFLSLIANINKF